MSKRVIRFIVNPRSGYKRGSKLLRYVEQYLDTDQYEFDLCYTKRAKHATVLAKEAVKENYFAVIAAGGDGTINEVAQSLVGSETALGIVPFGSGNGFSYHLGIRRSVQKAFEIINQAHVITVDTSTANGIFFLNVAGLGIDALVANITKLNKRRGLLPYVFNTVKQGLTYSGQYLSGVTEDGSTFEGNYGIAAIANGSIYGFDFAIAPDACLDDGKLDIVLIKQTNPLSYLKIAYDMVTKNLLNNPLVTHLTCSEVTIAFSGETYLHLDGEGTKVTDTLVCKVIPDSLKLIAEPKGLLSSSLGKKNSVL